MKKILLIYIILCVLCKITKAQEWCPLECACRIENGYAKVDCSGLNLDTLPEFEDKQIQYLDLSKNKFLEIPDLSEFSALEFLDLQSNQIWRIAPKALNGLTSLETLVLYDNNITNWADINPNDFMLPAVKLQQLSLGSNHITSLTNMPSLMLVSSSLKWLDLSNCKISKIVGNEAIEGLKQLEYLHLDGNPLRTISDLSSSSLKHLYLSGCKLGNIQPTALSKLTALIYINLSRNTQLSFGTKPKEYLKSDTLKRIDFSNCNLDVIPLNGLSNLITAILKGNMLKLVTADTFYDNPNIENLDLSSNSITYISGQSFRGLLALKNLDLSYNMIQKIEKDTFVENIHLTDINLSKTYLSKFSRLEADSVAHLNLSYCEIIEIEPDALVGMPAIKSLDLSKNIISEIPVNFSSDSLQVLDLSFCRLSIVRNYTFSHMPELTKLDLSGNRFTSTFRVGYFNGNRFLKEISLADNPWRCDCEDKEFEKFFHFITEPPGKIIDKTTLRCLSPDEVYGRTWESACLYNWFPDPSTGATEKVWTLFMVVIFGALGFLCVLTTVRKAIDGKRKRRRAAEQQEMLEEQRELARQNRIRLQQQAQLNAPDARESHPPCYEDAIRLPTLDSKTFRSLNDLSLGKKKRKQKDNDENDNEEVQFRRNQCRCHSEEVLSHYQDPVDIVGTGNVANKIFNRRRQPFENEPNQRISSVKPEDEIFYAATDILDLDHNIPSSSRSIPKIHDYNNKSNHASPFSHRKRVSDSLGEHNHDFTSKSSTGSPYSKRRSKHMSSFKNISQNQEESVASSSNHEDIIVIEDYYPAEERVIEDNEDFSTFTNDEIQGIEGNCEVNNTSNSENSSSSSSLVVVVHDRPRTSL